MSQEEFANALRTPELPVTRGAVGNWERGGGVKVDNLNRIREVFGADIDWLEFGRGTSPRRISASGAAVSGDTLLDDDQQGDGHPVDGHRATGNVAAFFAEHTGPQIEFWQITTDLLDGTACKPGVYVAVEMNRQPTPRCVVLAECRERDTKARPIFRVWVGGKLITASVTPSDTPTLIVDDDSIIVRGVVVAHKAPGT